MAVETAEGTGESPRFRFGIDIGGTFTDFVMMDSHTGTTHTYKTLTTPKRPVDAVLMGWTALLREAGAGGADVEGVIHGTTLITNALIERKGAKTALVTTKGFRDILEMRREMRYDIYDLLITLPEPLVPRPLRLEVDERLDASGKTVRPLDLEGLAAIGRHLENEGVEAVAICFLHSYKDPAHEQAAGRWLAQRHPDMALSLSSDVSPEIREYERMSTTVANAYVQPLSEGYLAAIQEGLESAGFAREMYLMLSSGGITTVQTASQFPIRLVESGPAAGALAAVFHGGIVGHADLVSFDMGGTTAKMCLIRNGQPSMTREFEIARVDRFLKGSGLPVQVPSVDLIEIGAGGGSIAHVDSLGLVKVGPRSAGAAPGPACYGLGGEYPTVTDADLILGYLNPEFFLGGRMALDRSAAELAVSRAIAEPLGTDVTSAAHAIYQVVNENMVGATRVHVAEKGVDARRLFLMAFGGAGPVHAHRIARALKMPGFICPADAGVASALGFLTAPTSFEFARSVMVPLEAEHLSLFNSVFGELRASGKETLAKAGVSPSSMRFVQQADMRHVGQGHEMVVQFPRDWTDREDGAAVLKEAFFEAYEAMFGHAHRHLQVEITTLRLTATGPLPKVELARGRSDGSLENARKGVRQVHFSDAGGFLPTPVYDRTRLPAGQAFSGPAIVEERDSTTVVPPESMAVADAMGNLVVTFDGHEEAR